MQVYSGINDDDDDVAQLIPGDESNDEEVVDCS